MWRLKEWARTPWNKLTSQNCRPPLLGLPHSGKSPDGTLSADKQVLKSSRLSNHISHLGSHWGEGESDGARSQEYFSWISLFIQIRMGTKCPRHSCLKFFSTLRGHCCDPSQPLTALQWEACRMRETHERHFKECSGRLCPPQLSSHTPFWSLGIALAWIEIDKPERVLVWGLAISVTPKYSTTVLCSTKPKNIGQALSPLIFKLMCFSRKCNPYVWGTFLCNSSNHARLYESFDV